MIYEKTIYSIPKFSGNLMTVIKNKVAADRLFFPANLWDVASVWIMQE